MKSTYETVIGSNNDRLDVYKDRGSIDPYVKMTGFLEMKIVMILNHIKIVHGEKAYEDALKIFENEA